MDPGRQHALAAAVAWAIPAAALATTCLPAAALVAGLGVCVCVATRRQGRHAGLMALPIVLCAMPGREPAPVDIIPGPMRLQGRVADIVRAPLTGHSDVTFVGGLRLRVPSELEAVPGDHLSILALAGRPAAPGWRPPLTAAAATAEVTPGPWGFMRACALLRRAIERSLLSLVPGEHGAMLATLVLGRATRPDFELTQAHRATGLSHLLAVSGAHAAMLAFLLGLTSRGRQLGASRARLGVVLSVLVVYGCVAGAEPPVVRAVIAFLLAATAARTGRPFGVVNGLLAPALVTAALTPAALTGPSFLLSYAAVIGLGIAAHRQRQPNSRTWLSQTLRASFWATLLTAPLTLWFFGQLAPTTILLTPLCAPLVAALLLLALIAASLAAFAAPLAELIAPVLQLLSATYAGIVYAADALPCTPVPARHIPPTWVVCVAGAATTAWVISRPRRSSVIGGALLLSACWFLPTTRATRPSLKVFAVGHGQAALITTSYGAQALIDCGSLQGGGRAARVIEPALTRRALELLVVTHNDVDHSNGLAPLLDKVRVMQAVMPAAMAETPVHALLRARVDRVRLLHPGEALYAETLSIHAPRVPDGAKDNDRSLWVRANVAGADVLLCGDAQELGVATAIASGVATTADVLLLPHHGRPNHNAPHLLASVRPRACLASAASADGDTAVGAIARRFGAEVWTTGRHGDLRFDGDAIEASTTPRLLARGANAR